MRGYFGIGIYHGKTSFNIGTLWRSANIYGASFIFTIGKRYTQQCTDTLKTHRHIPLYNYLTIDEMLENRPMGTQIVCIEQSEKSVPLTEFKHPQQAIYLLGAEDHGIPDTILEKHTTVHIPSAKEFCLNVSVAGSIVVYDRYVKGLKT